MDEPFSSIDFVVQCLVDSKRTKAFEKAIKKAVTPGCSVLDSGTGSGVMSLFAARAGAGNVTALEIDPYVASIAKKNVSNNKYENIITVVNEDIRSFSFDTANKYDVVIMEMLTTGMIDEYQVWAMNYLHNKGVIGPETKLIPFRQDTHATLVNVDFTMFGLNFRLPIHTWEYIKRDNPKIKNFSKRTLMNSITFDKVNDENFSTVITFDVKKTGIVNAIYLDSTTFLDKDILIPETLSLNGRVVIPFENDIEVKKGTKVSFAIKYHFGNGYRNFHIKLV